MLLPFPLRFVGGVPRNVRQFTTDNLRHVKTRPNRSFLYVPCSSNRMLQKSLGVNAVDGKAVTTAISDTVIYDLEDSVAPTDKEKARGQLVAFLKV